MDDVIILSNDKNQLRTWKERIGCFLETELELNLNNKTCIRPIGNGMEFVGYRVWADRVILRKSTTLRIKRSLKGIRSKYEVGKIPLSKVTETFICYIGMLKHTDSQALIEKLCNEMVVVKGGSREKEEKEEIVPMLSQEEWYLCYELFGVPGKV
jgi:hypothetical protein